VATVNWFIITGEYPPQPGGVSDYTALVANGLAQAGDQVEVCAPKACASRANGGAIRVHELPGGFGLASLRELNAGLAEGGLERQILVQYVPHAFGRRGLNLPFCFWLYSLRSRAISLVFHEVAYPFALNQPAAHNALAVVNRLMALLVARAASRIFITTQAWADPVKRMARRATPVRWIPVPSTIPVEPIDACQRAAIRARYNPRGSGVVGHFGTYGRLIRDSLAECIGHLAENEGRCGVLLLGRNSQEFLSELLSVRPEWSERVHALGELSPQALSRHVAACDVMLQPYPDGITSRRTSVMLALAHGIPVVTNAGHLTERFWFGGDAVSFAFNNQPLTLAGSVAELLGNEAKRRRVGRSGQALYSQKFDVRHTISALRSPT